MKKLPIVTMLLAAALSGLAEPLQWVCEWPKAKAQQFELYQGEIATFEPTFRINGGAPTNLPVVTVWYQTNGMDRAWWHTDGAVFHPTNDVGAASYRFFVDAAGDGGKLYRANGTLRMLPSPGFVPNTITPPVAALDFDSIDVSNAPYYSKAETDAKIVELSPPADLSQATNYTDSVASSLREGIAVAASSATNYTDAVASSLHESVAVAASSATNYTDNVATTLRGEIAAAQPADYATVSNKAMTALQSYTETDPTISSWAKAASKPTYSLNDVAPNVENWLGVPGTTAGGKSIKVLAKTVNGVIEGGMTVTGSSNNDNNTTKYRYGGVTATRNGTATDYLFDTSSQSGIVRRSELADKADADDLATLSNTVTLIETWAIGDETQLRIENAGQTNATLQITYTNDLMFSTAVAESNTLAKARADATALDLALADAFDTALAGKADRAWGNTTSSGAPSPTDTLVVAKPKLALTGGGNFSYIEADVGGYWVMSISLGSEWTLESLADAQNPTNPATIAMHDAEGNTAYTITSTSSREAYAVDGEQYIYCRSVGGNDVITLTYPVVADSAPTIEYTPSLTNEFAAVENWPGYIASVVPTGHSGMWTNTVTMVGHPGKGFFKGKYTKAGHTYTRFNQPIGITQITIDDVTYDISVETINGKKLMVLTEAD